MCGVARRRSSTDRDARLSTQRPRHRGACARVEGGWGSVLLFATAWILWYLWVNSQMRIFSGVRVLILFFFFAAIGDFARARGGGGVKKGTKRKKGDEFTYIEVFKRLIASGDAMTR